MWVTPRERASRPRARSVSHVCRLTNPGLTTQRCSAPATVSGSHGSARRPCLRRPTWAAARGSSRAVKTIRSRAQRLSAMTIAPDAAEATSTTCHPSEHGGGPKHLAARLLGERALSKNAHAAHVGHAGKSSSGAAARREPRCELSSPAPGPSRDDDVDVIPARARARDERHLPTNPELTTEKVAPHPPVSGRHGSASRTCLRRPTWAAPRGSSRPVKTIRSGTRGLTAGTIAPDAPEANLGDVPPNAPGGGPNTSPLLSSAIGR
jgi:hypothetical protein